MATTAKNNYLIVIGGPTASGKTGVAIQIAQHFDIPILSCDSRQLYKEITIGTAKPSIEELAAAPHYFINHKSIHDTYTTGDYEHEALELLQHIYQKKDAAILVGGTGLYIKAVCEGLDHFPTIPPSIRNTLEQELEENGINPLQEELKVADPIYFEQVDQHNPRRIIRALEVIRHTGKPFSFFRTQKKKERFFTPIYIKLEMDRTRLYERINQRVDLMLEMGLMKEIHDLYPHKQLNALQTVGYQEYFDFLDGKISFEEATELVKRNSRRYAKRQMTWLRRNEHWLPYEASAIEDILTSIKKRIQS